MKKKEEEPWDYDKSYHYALSLISKQACNTAKLTEKLSKKTTKPIVALVMESIDKAQLIHDDLLCEETSLLWIQKKPISYPQLYKKLVSYGFSSQNITHTMQKIQERYIHGEINMIGNITRTHIFEITTESSLPTIWSALTLTAVIHLSTQNQNIDNDTIIRRLQMRGYDNITRVMKVFDDYKDHTHK